jgi:hypothetical protein
MSLLLESEQSYRVSKNVAAHERQSLRTDELRLMEEKKKNYLGIAVSGT